MICPEMQHTPCSRSLQRASDNCPRADETVLITSIDGLLLTTWSEHGSDDALQAVSREVPPSDQLAALYASLENQQHARWQQQYVGPQQPATGHPVQAQRQSLDGYSYMSQSYEDLSAQQVRFDAVRRLGHEKQWGSVSLPREGTPYKRRITPGLP